MYIGTVRMYVCACVNYAYVSCMHMHVLRTIYSTILHVFVLCIILRSICTCIFVCVHVHVHISKCIGANVHVQRCM